jgi:hypothetical protein
MQMLDSRVNDGGSHQQDQPAQQGVAGTSAANAFDDDIPFIDIRHSYVA